MLRYRRPLVLLVLALLLAGAFPADALAQDDFVSSRDSTPSSLSWWLESVTRLVAKIGIDFEPSGVALPEEESHASQAEEAVTDPVQRIGIDFEPSG